MTEEFLRQVDDEETRLRAMERAREIAGTDEYRLSSDWLSDPDVFVMAEENENHAGEHTARKLSRAGGVFPSGLWFAASVFAGEPSELLRVVDPVRALRWEPDGAESLGAVYSGQTFLLFCLEEPAAILYSEHEYTLVAGSRAFVAAYFGDLEDAEREIEDFFDEQRDMWGGNEKMAEEIERRRANVRAQIRKR